MTKERTCQGCNGKGRRLANLLPVTWNRCYACEGAGVVVDRITREDAIADAETLSEMALNAMGLYRVEGCSEDRTAYHLREAQALARSAINGARDFSGERATAAYYAALKAVPGLRDEARA